MMECTLAELSTFLYNLKKFPSTSVFLRGFYHEWMSNVFNAWLALIEMTL